MEENFTPEQSAIRSEIDSILQSDSYRNAFSPDHPATQEKVQALYSKLYPEEGGEPEQPRETPTGETEQPSETEPTPDPIDNPEQAAIEESLRPLKEEWKGDYQKNLEAAQGVTANLVREYGIDGAEVFDLIGNSPIVVKNLYEWSQGRPGDNLTAAEAKEVIALLQKTDAYKSGASRTSETVQQITQALYQIAYGD